MMNDEWWDGVLTQLAQPFSPKDVQWRAGATTRDGKKAQALAFVDPRVYEQRLDAVVKGRWDCIFTPWGEQRLICSLMIAGATRSSTGEFDSGDTISKGTTAEAQAFKRACSKFGLGRYLYDLPVTWVSYDSEKRRLLETPKLPKQAAPKALHIRIGELLEGLGFGDKKDRRSFLAFMLGITEGDVPRMTAQQKRRVIEALSDEDQAQGLIDTWAAHETD